jgi:hypothetical protein
MAYDKIKEKVVLSMIWLKNRLLAIKQNIINFICHLQFLSGAWQQICCSFNCFRNMKGLKKNI